MIRISVCLAFCLFAAAAHAGDCAKLNPGDGFKELLAILECQEQRIKALEQSRGVAGVTASIAADGIWKRGKCLPYARDQAFKMTITIEETDGGVPLCWKERSPDRENGLNSRWRNTNFRCGRSGTELPL